MLVDGRGGRARSGDDARTGPCEVHPGRDASSVQLNGGTRGAVDLRIATGECRGWRGAGDVHRKGHRTLVEVGDGHGVRACGHVGEDGSHGTGAPDVAIARGSTRSAGRGSARTGVAGIEGGVDGGGERCGLAHDEVRSGTAAVGIGHRYADGPCAKVVGGGSGLSIAPGEGEGCLTVGGGGDAAVVAAVARDVAHHATGGHDAHLHHLVGGSGENAGISTDDATDVGVRRDRPDQGAGQILAGGTCDVRPGEAVSADLPLVRGGAAERRVGGGRIVAQDGGQHVARLGAGDVAWRTARADGHALIGDAVPKEIGRIGPHHQPGFVPRGGTVLGRIDRALGEGDVVASGSDDGVDPAVAELDAALSDRIVIVRRAAIVGAEQQRAQVVLQFREGLVVAALVGGLQRHVRRGTGREVGAVRVPEDVHVIVLVDVEAHHVDLVAAAAEIGGAEERLIDAHAADVEVVASVV